MNVVDSILLTQEEENMLEMLAALNYSISDMALYFKQPEDIFELDAKTEGCRINILIRRGKLVARANPDIKLLESANSGNITAIQQLSKRQKEYKFEEMLDELFDE